MTEKFEVVISGISGRFPECDDMLTFKEKLYNGDDFVTVDNRKWPVGYRHKITEEKVIPDATGKLRNIHKFDYTVFKMNTTFANSCDAVNRIILEPSFECIIDAGVNPYSLDGSNVAVLMSTCLNELRDNITNCNVGSNILTIIGSCKTMQANRVSFSLNLTGPSYMNYTDVHGGLESLVMAYKYVSEGFVEAAIVGAASNIQEPRYNLQLHALDILSPDGITRPFDKWANGTVRSEGVVCFFLQRAEDAKRSYGEIKFCDFSYMGSILPNFIYCYEDYIKAAVRNLRDIDDVLSNTSNIAFVEMNAYGNKFMDENESNAVAELLSTNRKDPLLVGSIKSNIGHTAETAGFMAVLKALLALDSGTLAPNLHLSTLNDNIRAFKEKRLQVVTEKMTLPGNSIAVHSVGLLGSVGLAVIRQHEKSARVKSYDETLPKILLISGREENALRAKLSQIEKLPYNSDFVNLANDAWREYMPLHMYRGFTLLPTPFKPIHDIKERGERNRPVWFIFSGMGSQWNGMGKSLLKLPLFAQIVDKCDKVLKEKNIDIYNILTTDDLTLFDDIKNAFVGIITVQIGLYEVIKALGIQPDGILGHSVGENGCAYADGCLSLEQAVLASWARGMASTEVVTIKGMMAAIGKGYSEMKRTALPEEVQIACHNSSDSCTLTGPAESVEAFVQKLQKEGVFAKAVNVANIAYHSKYIAPAGQKLLHRLKQVITEPRERSSKWISTSVPENEWDKPLAQYCSAEYLTNNLLSPVLFEEACKHIPANAICIEFAPHGLLQAILKRSLPSTCTNISLTNRSHRHENLNTLLTAIGKLYIGGLEPRVNNIFPSSEYPVPRETPSLSHSCTWYHQNDPIPYHLSSHFEEWATSSESIPICIRDDSEYSYLKNHKINDNVAIPPSFFMYLVWRIFSYKRVEKVGSSSVVFEDVQIHNNVTITLQDTKYAFITIQWGSGCFEVILQDQEDSVDFQVILTGSINPTSGDVKTELPKLSEQNKSSIIMKSQFYDVFKHAGYQLREEFVLLEELRRYNSEYETKIIWNENWVTFLDTLMKVQMFADNDGNIDDILPTRIRRLDITATQFWSLKKGTILSCKIDAVTHELRGPSLTMFFLKYKSIPRPDRQLNKFRFVAYENPRCQNIYEFLNLCLQIAVENAAGCKFNKLTILDMTNAYSQIIEQIINEQILLQKCVVLQLRKEIFFTKGCILIVTNEMEKVAKLGSSVNNVLMILVVLPFTFDSDVKMKQCFVEVTKQSFSGTTFALLKKKSRSDNNQMPLHFLDSEKKQPKKKVRENMSSRAEPCFVVKRNIEFKDISRLIAKRKSPSNMRYLYIMDEVVNSQQLDEVIERQRDLNLTVSVIKQGEWGSYRNLAQDNIRKCGNEDFKTTLLSNINAGSVKLNYQYVCLHTENVYDHALSEQNLDFTYAALINGTEKRIGFATIYSSGSPQCDEYLFWTPPNTWTSKEAATVPYIYAQAYNLLHSSLHQRPANTVMINVGTEYLLVEAIIALALYKNQELFLIVCANEESVSLVNKFPKLKSHCILQYQNYELQIRKLTKGKGVDLVINCLPGIQHVNASLSCVANFGYYTEVGSSNIVESLNIGLYDFVRNVSFNVVRNRISDLLKLTVDTKKKMKQSLEKYINEGVVLPPQVRQQIQNVTCTIPVTIKTIKCKFLKETQNVTSRTMKYDGGKHLYAIVAAGKKNNLWAVLIKWLIAQGARKFVVFLQRCTLRSHTSYQIQRLLAQKNVKILLSSASKLDNKQEIYLFLNEVEELGPLKAVFFESIKMAGKKVSNLDDIVSSNVYFIGLSSGGLKEFEHRRSKGSPAILIHYEEFTDALAMLPHLNDLLTQNDNNNTEVLHEVADINSHRNNKVASPRLQDYLPQDIETLNAIGQDKNEELKFIEMTSLSKKYSHGKGIFPIFVLPAVHSIILQPLFQRLLYPVFSATEVSICSKKEAADSLYQSLESIQPSGPVTLISETWNLPLALDLMCRLQHFNRKYKLFVLEGNPANWKNEVDQLQTARTKKMDAVYADEIFHFDSVARRKTFPTGSISFESKVRMYAKNASSDTRTVENIIKAAHIIRDKIAKSAEQHFNPSKLGLLSNLILFERHRPNDREFNISVTSEIVVLNEPDYKSLLIHPEVSRVINENAPYSWLKTHN